jgi:DNA-binding response OmpR family regulator
MNHRGRPVGPRTGIETLMRILVVDDEGNIRRMLRALLEGEGWSVDDVPTAEAGLARARESPPEVILLDLALPG